MARLTAFHRAHPDDGPVQWDWFGTAATAVVGLAGIAGTLRGVNRHVETQRATAREERHERRLEAAYLELLGEVAIADDWSETLFYRWNTPDDGPMPTVPAIYVNRLSGEGRLSAWWSPRMRELVVQLQRTMRELYGLWLTNSSATASLRQQRDPGPTGVELLEQFIERKVSFADTVLAIRRQVAAELRGRTYDPAADGYAQPGESS